MSQAVKSIREQAILAVVSLLASSGTPASNVFRSRVDQIDQADLPCYDVTPGEGKTADPGEFGDRGSVTQTQGIVVRAMVNATGQDDSALDPFYVFAVQQLAGAPATLGGLVLQVDELGTATVFQPNGNNLIGLEMHFDLVFAVKRGDPTQKG